MNPILAQWNELPHEEAVRQILPCCGSRAWADRLAANRPYLSPEVVIAASDRAWRNLSEAAWMEAFATHPRIGERHANATPRSLAWSATEQSAVDETAQIELAEVNRLYESRFNRTFIVRAAGRSAPEILAILHRRLRNTPAQELAETAEQQGQITQLRLEKWLAG